MDGVVVDGVVEDGVVEDGVVVDWDELAFFELLQLIVKAIKLTLISRIKKSVIVLKIGFIEYKFIVLPKWKVTIINLLLDNLLFPTLAGG